MFKLNGKDRPPPPPPKDTYYLQNKSMTSLSPDSLSIPPQSPLSPHYLSQYPHRQSLAPSQSTMSLVSSAASQLSVTPTDQATPKKKKSLNFLKFGKRSKSSSQDTQTDVPPPPPLTRQGVEDQGDSGVTWPSNFQHNVHVDDELTGLPPSWAKSLVERGFTEEEIAMINAKRAANSRMQQIYTGRPDSPASYNPPSTGASQSHTPPIDRSTTPSSNEPHASPVLTHPTPRSTSLSRKFSSSSAHGRSPHPTSTNVPIPTLVTSPSLTSLHSIRTNSTSTSSRHHAPPLLNTTPSTHTPSSTMSSDSHLSYQTANANAPPAVSTLPAVPGTPTRRFQVANPNTPPPAYTPSRIVNGPIAHQDVKTSNSPPSTATGVTSGPVTASSNVLTLSLPIPPSSHRSQASVESTASSQGSTSTESSSHSTPQLQRQPSQSLSQPPRLSLHASNDSDDWSNLVLSASSLMSGDGGGSQNLSGFRATEAKPAGPVPRPIPPIIVPDNEESGASASSSQPPSGWAEASSTARYPPSIATSSPPTSSSPSWKEFKQELEDFVEKDDFKEAPLSAALTESFSPTIPDGLSRSRQRDTLRPGPDGTLLIPPGGKYSSSEGADEDDDDFLSVRRSNRDSSRSSTSTLSASTVTGYTYSTPPQIIRNASVVRRAGAYVTKLPAPTSPSKETPSLQQQLISSSSARRSVVPMQAVTEDASLVENPPMSPMGVGFQLNRDSGSSSGSRRQSGAPPSPMNSQFGSDESTGSASTNSTVSSAQSQDQSTPVTDPGSGGGLGAVELDLASYYTNTPSPSRSSFAAADYNQKPPPSPRDTFGNAPKESGVIKVISRGEDVDASDSFVDLGKDDDDEFEGQVLNGEEEEDEEGTWDTLRGNIAAAAFNATAARPLIIVSGEPTPPSLSTESIPLPTSSAASSSLPGTPLTPVQRYPGWLSGVVNPLTPFIDEAIEPRDHYVELQEIAEGESGSIFAARVNPTNAGKLRLHPNVKSRDALEMKKGAPALVAVKIIAITPPSSSVQMPEAQKLVDLERELKLMKGLWHENILGLDALYVDLTEDTLWVRMELMERSLADIVGLVPEGLMIQDRMIARFAQDVLHGLQYLQENRIAHRDVRSDNLLLNSHGILKLTDFSNAVKLPAESSLRSDPAGVIFWQAPEMRYPNYDALKVDVWSLGATVWEMAETEPPFSDTKQVQSRWPPLTRPEIWSPAFRSFLRACSDPAAVRKNPGELLKDPFVSNVCGRGVIVQLLQQCMNIERAIQSPHDP